MLGSGQQWHPKPVSMHDDYYTVIFWKVTVLFILSKKSIYVCVLNQMVSEMVPFHYTVPKLSIRKINYVLFLIPIFIAQVTKLVQFT
jgi:hypothetical protein